MQMNMSIPVTPVVKWLIIINLAVWVVFQLIVERLLLGQPIVTLLFGLVPFSVLQKFFVWQTFSYMFLHSYSVFHIVFNLLLLWMMGSELEQRWGSRFFLIYYLVCGWGAGVIYSLTIGIIGLVTGSFPGWTTPVIGASGAIFGLMLAYGIIFGERIVYFFMIFPMKAKVFVLLLGAIEFVTLLSSGIGGSDVANLAHLGGIISGFLFLKVYTHRQQNRWRKRSGERGRGLRLVVNNDRKKEKDGPKYWN